LEGRYRLHLSRWPFHLDRSLTAAGPAQAVGGRKINPGKALPIAFGCVALNDGTPTVIKTTDDATEVTLEMTLSAGDQRLQTWFRDSAGQDICGAYYLRVEWIGER